MKRPWLLVVILTVLLLAAIVLVVLYARGSGPAVDQSEREASESARTPVSGTPTGREGALGSGASLTTDWYQLYFTGPIYPDNPRNHQGGLDTRLVELMDRATRTLDVAVYDFDLTSVAGAMARARQRGVQVRMVTDTDTLTNDNTAIQAAFNTLKQAGIPIVDDQRQAIMHNKFTVVDQTWVSTGSWNYSDGDTYRLNNNMIVIQSSELSENYTAQFEKMFLKRQFGPSRDKNIPNPSLTIQGTRIQNCFAPEGKCGNLIIDTIGRAQSDITFLAFSFTHDGIAEAMLKKWDAGVQVQGVFETTGSQTRFSEYGKMKEKGLEVYTDGSPWVMHHKVIIIDDRIVIFGSFNFSDNADTSNDENLLIVDNPDIARAFKTEYAKVLDTAMNPPVRQ
jgi:phosphatidylserine/phosphatidylglycerophosphate/cardiolipin synthase-like enzyme